MSGKGHSRRYCHVRSLVRYPQHRTLRRPTETRLLAALLRSFCKQRVQPPQLLRPGFARSGTRDACTVTNDSAYRLQQNLRAICGRGVGLFFLFDRSLAKDFAGTARPRPPTERWQDKRTRGARRSGGRKALTDQTLRTRCEKARQPADWSNPLSKRQIAHLAANVTHSANARVVCAATRPGGRSVARHAHRSFFWRKSRATLRTWLALANPDRGTSPLPATW